MSDLVAFALHHPLGCALAVAIVVVVIAALRPERARVLDTVLAAAEGRPFEDLGLPFPRPK